MRRQANAELFLAESAMAALADVGDDAYDSERNAEGVMLGRFLQDARGTYAEAVTLVPGTSSSEGAVGWYRSSERDGVQMTDADLKKHLSLFGKRRAYAVMISPAESSLAIYAVEDGVPVRIPAAILDGV